MIKSTLGTADGPGVINPGQWYRVARNKTKQKSKVENKTQNVSTLLVVFSPISFCCSFLHLLHSFQDGDIGTPHSDPRVSICDVIRRDDY